MAGEPHDGAAVRLPPPAVFVLALVAGVALHELVSPLPVVLPRAGRIALAVALAVVGAGLVAAALGLFRRTGQDPKPWKSTPEIISGGVYAWTRNPMYVGMALLQTAIGIASCNGWILALVPVSLAIVYWTAIRHEEAYLARKFGEAYARYKAAVGRWL